MGDQQRHHKADEIFIEVLELPPADRSRFLAQLSSKIDESILREVEELLSVDQRVADQTLDGNPHVNVAKFVPATTETTVSAEDIGSMIGKYQILQQLGEGGMGVVYMADQKHPVNRRVALKVIKPGMDSKSVVARFEAERQALAMMDHPNIARVLDVGTTESGRPYFVMELVKGIPITQYCDENRSSVRERLELFESVCHAVQHAHQKGVIHRDLKPSNILVAEYDDIAVPKVIDFGLAKALQHSLTDKTLFTQFGQIVGTFEYMSPEQAKLNQLDIDTRTDIYSLGVLLYELLTGQMPFDAKTLRDAAFDEMLRVIRDIDPPKPSTRLTNVAALSSKAAAVRRSDPRRLQAALAGDLDAITMKSLSKDRARRYQSSTAFAEDVRRFLDNEPVVAHAPSSLYRITKFVARHRVAVGSTLAVLCALVIGLVSVTWFAHKNRQLAQRNFSLFEEKSALAEANGAIAEEKSTLAEANSELANEKTALAETLRNQLYVADVDLAQREWEAGDVSHAMKLLNRQIPSGNEPDLRQFEWFHLWRLCNESKPAVLVDRESLSSPSPESLQYEVIDRDGVSHVAVQTKSGEEVAVWRLGSTEAPEHTWTPPIEGSMTNTHAGYLAFTSRGPGEPRRMAFCDPVTGKEISSHDIDKDLRDAGYFTEGDRWGATDQVKFSRDGRMVALRSDQYAVMCWKISEDLRLSPIWHLPSLEGYQRGEYVYPSYGLAFGLEAKRLAVAREGEVIVLDTASGQVIQHLEDRAGILRYASDGNLVVRSDRVHVWNTELDLEVRSFDDGAGRVELSPDGKTIAVGVGPIVRLRNLETGELLKEFRGHIEIGFLKFAPSGEYLLVSDSQGLNHWRVDETNGTTPGIAFSQYDLPTFQILSGLPRMANMSAFDPSGRWLACAAGNSFLVWDLSEPTSEAHSLDAEFSVPESALARSVAFSADGNSLVTGGRSPWGTRIWEWPSRRLLTKQAIPGGLTVLDKFGKRRASTRKSMFIVTDVASGETIAEPEIGARNTPAFSPSGKSLAIAAGSADPGREMPGRIHLFDIEAKKVRWVYTTDVFGHARNTAFSPDGTLIAASFFRQEEIPIVHAEDGKLYGTLDGHVNDTTSEVAFSPDGRTLVSSGSSSSTLILWNVATLTQRFVVHGSKRFTGIAFSPDGRTLAVGHGTDMWLLRAATDKEVAAKSRDVISE